MSALPRPIGQKIESLPAYTRAESLDVGTDLFGLPLVSKRVQILLALIVFFGAVCLRLYGFRDFAQTVDEPHWVSRSAKINAKAELGRYADLTTHLGHPGLPAALSMAVAQRAAGKWNALVEAGAPIDRVAASRLACIVLSSLAVPLLFLGALPFIGWAPALLAAVMLAFDPQHISISRLAHLDGTLTTFSLATAFCFFWYERRPGLGKTLALGVLLGLALGTKPTAVALLPGLFIVRLILRRSAAIPAAIIQFRDLAVLVISHLVLLLLWTKLWDPNHNFIKFLRVRAKLASLLESSGKYLQAHDSVGLALVAAALVLPLGYLFRTRRRGGRIAAETMFCALIPAAFLLLLWRNSLPLENIVRFWGWVIGLSREHHDSYGQIVEPPALRYLEIWWKRMPLLVFVGLVCATVTSIRRPSWIRGFAARVSPGQFLGACLAVVFFWSVILSVSDKQAFRYVLPVYPLVIAAAAFGLFVPLRSFRGVKLGLVVATISLPFFVRVATALPEAGMLMNPLAGRFRTAVGTTAVGTTVSAIPLGYEKTFEVIHAAVPPGTVQKLEAIGEVELVRSEYARRYLPEEFRIKIGDFRGGYGADWMLELARPQDDKLLPDDWRLRSKTEYVGRYDGVALYRLMSVPPLAVGETVKLSIARARTEAGAMRDTSVAGNVLRIRPKEVRDHAFFDLAVKTGPGKSSIRFPLGLAVKPGDGAVFPDSPAIVLRADNCARYVRVGELPENGAMREIEMICESQNGNVINLAGIWFGRVGLHIGDIVVTKLP